MNIKQDEKRLITYYLTRLFWLHYFDYTILATPFCQLAPIKGVYIWFYKPTASIKLLQSTLFYLHTPNIQTHLV